MVRRVFNIVYREVRGLHQAAYILALFAVGSQLLAVIRDRLLAHVFGAGSTLDTYYAAFRVPDLLFVLFASIVSVYVLLPFVSREVASNKNDEGHSQVLSQVFTLFLIIFSSIAVVLAVFAPWYVPRLFPGLSDSFDILISLLRILLLQAFLLGLSNLCGVVTQASNRFVLFALSPILYNLGIIFGIVALYPLFGLEGLVYGVVFGALLHLLIQVPFVLRSQYRFSLSTIFDWSLLRQILAIAIPRGLTLSINQLVLLFFIGIATTMAAGSVSVFQFAFNLQSVPLAVVGMSYSVAAFPALSRLLAEKKQIEFNTQLLVALRHIVFWSVPIIFLVIVLRAQIVRVLLGSGAFDWEDTRLTAAVLAIFVVSLAAQAVLLLLIRAFYAAGKTFVPLVVSSGAAVIGVSFAIVAVNAYEKSATFRYTVSELFRLDAVLGSEVLVLAAGFVLMQVIQLVLLLIASKQVFGIKYHSLARLTTQALVAGAGAGLAAYITLSFVVVGVKQTTFIGIGLQGFLAGLVGIAIAAILYWLMKAPEVEEIYRSFRVKLLKTDVVREQPDTPLR